MKGLPDDLQVTSSLRDDQIKCQPIHHLIQLNHQPETNANNLFLKTRTKLFLAVDLQDLGDDFCLRNQQSNRNRKTEKP